MKARRWNSGFHKMWGISWQAGWLSTSQVIFSMELVSMIYLQKFIKWMRLHKHLSLRPSARFNSENNGWILVKLGIHAENFQTSLLWCKTGRLWPSTNMKLKKRKFSSFLKCFCHIKTCILQNTELIQILSFCFNLLNIITFNETQWPKISDPKHCDACDVNRFRKNILVSAKGNLKNNDVWTISKNALF
jgi:hypothetical protein